MKIARHWKCSRIQAMTPDGRTVHVGAWGWSADSADEARQRADEAAQRVAARVSSGQGFPERYGYFDRPRREKIVEEFTGSDGELIAVITRNGYGSLVLNTVNLAFIDIDVPLEPPFSRLVRTVKGLFGMTAPDPDEQVRERIARVAAQHPENTFRLYKTAAGFRCAVINRRIDPSGPAAESLLSAFGADPLYVRLCRTQGSFRARLSPKPWRCGVQPPPVRFPFDTPETERLFSEWEAMYEPRAENYSTCRFVEQFGHEHGTADFRRLIEIHDRFTGVEHGRPLA